MESANSVVGSIGCSCDGPTCSYRMLRSLGSSLIDFDDEELCTKLHEAVLHFMRVLQVQVRGQRVNGDHPDAPVPSK